MGWGNCADIRKAGAVRFRYLKNDESAMVPGAKFRQALNSILMLLVIACLMSGCAQGPKWVRSDWREYNDTVVDVSKRELLLNIIRLRYNDYPGVLKIGSLTAQRNWSVNGSLAGTIPEGGPDSLSLGIGGLRSERPTVAFLPGSKESVTATLTPLSLESLYLASYLEWPASTYLPLMVKSINGVQNAPKGGGPMPTEPPQFHEFFELALNLKQLQDRDLVEVGRIEKLEPLNKRVMASTLTAAESREAAEAGYAYQESDREGEIVLSRREQVSVLRFSPQALGTPEHSMIVELLGLDPTRLIFEFEPAFKGTLADDYKNRENLEVGLRSLIEMLFLASKGVDVPECHLANNIAPSSDFAIDWQPVIGGFRVHCCDEKPNCAAVSVCYRGCWFYIADNDQDSKNAFFFIKLIYDAQVQGGGAENLPVLTLPL